MRAGSATRSPRVPTQERSKKRYQAILDAAVNMLETANIEDISLHDIGKATGLPPASVHYLFSTFSAVHYELNKYYNERLTVAITSRARELVANGTWQDLVRATMKLARTEYNNSRAMSEVMLGPSLHRSIRSLNLENNAIYAEALVDLVGEFFILPELPEMSKYFVFSSELVEGLWAAAYARYGEIDDLTFEESVRACLAYLRCFFPEFMARRV